MAIIGATALTIVDWAKRLDKDGKFAVIAEQLNQTNEMLDDALWLPTTDMMSSRVTIRTGLPDVYYRMTGQAVPISKSETTQVVENCAILTGWSEIDEDQAEITGDVKMARLSEAAAFWESMNQKFCETMIYGSASNPEEFVGLANRYSSLSAGNAQNIISAGGSGSDNTSIYLMGWGPRTVHCQYPKGSKAGLQHKDHGLQVINVTEGGVEKRMTVYQDQWSWKHGLILRDWRYVVRICNIDVSALIADGAGASVKLMEYMLKAVHRLPSTNNVKLAFYANRTVKEMLDIQAQNKSNVHLSVGGEEGNTKVKFRGIPIRTVDRILLTEAAVA